MRIFFYFFGLFTVALSQANYQYKGRILDAETKEPLVGVNLYRESTIEGTASDLDGNFVFLSTVKGPTVKVSYVGYKTQTINLDKNRTIYLKEDIITSSTVVVYAGGLSRAQQIILNCIESYQERLKQVSAIETRVYSKVFFRRKRNKRDSMIDDSLRNSGEDIDQTKYIPWVFETYKKINWEKPDRINQVILKRKQGKAYPAMFNVFGVIFYQNAFYKRFMEHDSPLNIKYFGNFKYRYGGKILHQSDSLQIVFANRVDSANYWNYKFLIDSDFNLKKIEVAQRKDSPKQHMRISPIISLGNAKNITVMQDYIEYLGLTLPQNYFITQITERGVVRLSELYQDIKINNEVEAIRFSRKQFQIKPDVDDISQKLWEKIRPIPLNTIEKQAYVASDSLYQTKGAWDRFMFDYGFKIFLFDYRIGNYKLTSFNDLYHYNPVEGHFFGLGIRNFSSEEFNWNIALGYATALKKIYGRVSINFPLIYQWNLSTAISFYNEINPLNSLTPYYSTISTFDAIFYHNNNTHYMLKTGFNFSIERQVSNDFTYGFIYRNQKYFGQDNHSDFSIFNADEHYVKNLNIGESSEHEFALKLSYEEMYNFDLGSFIMKFPKKNAWKINAELTFDVNNWSNAQFKRATFHILKSQNLSDNLSFQVNSDLYYVGRAVRLSNVFFPRTPEFFDPNVKFSLAGFERYLTGSFDYASIGVNFNFYSPLSRIGLQILGDFNIFGQAFTMNNYGVSKLANVKIKYTKLGFNYGISIANKILFVPLEFIVMHNSITQSTSFFVAFGTRLPFQ